MMRVLTILAFICLFFSCNSTKKELDLQPINSVEVTSILNDSTLSIRAIELLDDGNLAFAANNNTYGLYDLKTNAWSVNTHPYDTLNLEFRATAHTKTDFFMLTVSNPGLLFKTGNRGRMELVYKEEADGVFYDAMKFWNDREGIAIGDPVDDCLSIIVTRDGGVTWTKLSCDELPKGVEGEAAFAASNTNIAIVGDYTWVATGGKVSRIYFSADKGKTWDVYTTPILQGEATTGIFSIDFYDENQGFAIGGDYTKPEINTANKLRTTDGGKTWELVANGTDPGYRSCVQYVPNTNGKSLISVGFNGIDVSNDRGDSWQSLSMASFYSIRFVNDSLAFASGKGRIAKLKFIR